MLNSPQQTIFDTDSVSDELIPSGSPSRLWCIGGLFTIAAFIVAGRVAWVQVHLPAEYLQALQSTTIEDEILPARDGRILAESVALAADVDQYEVQLHYRWLQETPDSAWLRLQVRQRLSRDERRNPELVAVTEQAILKERSQMMDALAHITGVPYEELQVRCARVEKRVQRISDSVNRRQGMISETADEASKNNDGETNDDEENDTQNEGFISRWASSVRNALTTPPRRENAERIVVREEESWHPVLENIDLEVAAQISEQPETFPGVKVIATTQRVYPQHDLAVHVVGARTKVVSGSDGNAEATADQPIRSGQFGVEKSYNQRLSGIPGLRRIVRDRRQRVISSEVVRKPVSGRDVMLTIDIPLQQLAEQLLAESLGDAERVLLGSAEAENINSLQINAETNGEERPSPDEPDHIPTGGCVIVMEADSGRLIAAASAPEFDLSLFTNGTQNQWEAVNSDVRRPFVPRFIGMALPPGSTFKIVTAMAGLQSGALTPDERFDCAGYLIRPDEHRCLVFRHYGHGHGLVNLRTAMAQSCNVYFFDAAKRMGIAPLSDWAGQLQFGQETGIDLPFEKSGTLPRAASGSSEVTEAEQRRFEREALGFAIGQSRLTVTPLQMARLLGFVANGGWLVTPHVVSDEGVAHTADDPEDSPYRSGRRRIPGVAEETLQAIREGLRSAVDDPIGTGYRTIRLKEVSIAGKTGTAETSPDKPDHAWFTGYAPADEPRYVFVVVLEHGGSGSKAAGPIVKELARSMFQRGLL